jgi:hypothetical protein
MRSEDEPEKFKEGMGENMWKHSTVETTILGK